jgi:hypothetical protein
MTTHNIQLLKEFPGLVLRCKNNELLDVTQEFYEETIVQETTEQEKQENKEPILETTCSQAEFVSEEDTDKE